MARKTLLNEAEIRRFMKLANKAIAKTVMRKKDFKTRNQKLRV